MTPWISLWFRAFAATLLIETAIAVPLLGRRSARRRRLGAVLLANLATHPVVWHVLPELSRGRLSWESSVLVSELWVVGVEAWCFRLVFSELRWTRCFAVAALANAVSTLVGLGLRALGVPL